MAADAQGERQWSVSDREYLEAMLSGLERRFEKSLGELERLLAASIGSQKAMTEAAFLNAEKSVYAAMIAAEKAVSKAEISTDKRFEAVNEFRGMLSDIVNKMIPRAEAEQRFVSLSTFVNKLDVDLVQGLSLLEKNLSDKIHKSEGRLDLIQGSSMGMKTSWNSIMVIVVAVIAAASLAVSIIKP